MRASGVLMHISSLPGKTGIGTLGKSAYEFADFLERAGQSYWQILPLCPTGYGDSPYQSFSTFAGNPYFIDFDLLCESGLLKRSDYSSFNWGKDEEKVDFDRQYANRFKVLKKAVDRFNFDDGGYSEFSRENSFWLDDYALYMALKIERGGKPWTEWEDDIKQRSEKALSAASIRLKDEILFWKAVQYLFYGQWYSLKEYVNSLGIKIIGDIPIYVALDSADVWANPANFQLDENKKPSFVAGCPPDAFTKDGQLWGNPLYDWEYMKNDGYAWWKKRTNHICRVCDIVRIDHFRGFESYYSIPYGAPNAKKGTWEKGPGIEFFREIEKNCGKKNLIAEDLGFLTPGVKKMLRQSRYPGMKVLQFAFDSDGDCDYTLHHFTKNSVAYVGTHDNDTAIGYIKNAPRKTAKRAKEYLRLTRREGYNWGMMKSVWSSASDTAIVTMQDLLGLGSEARMNFPSTVRDNWQWRAKEGSFDDELAEKTRYYTALYKRLPEKRGKVK